MSSNSSTRSVTTSECASALAKNEDQWIDWALEAGVDQVPCENRLPDAVIPISEIFIPFELPETLKLMDEKERETIRSNAAALSPSNLPHLEGLFKGADCASAHFSLSENIGNQLKALLPLIVNLTRRLHNLQRPAWRQPIDELLSKVFMETDDMQYRMRYEIVLPHSTNKVNPSTAILDAAVISFRHWPVEEGDTQYAEEACCTKTLATGPCIPILHWVAEYNPARGRNHLMYGLATAQMQRIAMGFLDHIVYGVALGNGDASIYVSWVDPESKRDLSVLPRILIQFIKYLDMFNLLHVIQFTILLLRIKEDMKQMRSEIDSLTVDTLKAAQAGRASWRAARRPPSGSASQSPNSQCFTNEAGRATRIAKGSNASESDDDRGFRLEHEVDEEAPDVESWAEDVYRSGPFEQVSVTEDYEG